MKRLTAEDATSRIMQLTGVYENPNISDRDLGDIHFRITGVLSEYAPESVDAVQAIKSAQGAQTLTCFATSLDISPTYISDIYNGHRQPGPKILKALNLVKETSIKRWR